MKRVVCGIIIVSAFLAGQAGAVIMYNDGLVHEISTDVYQDIAVYDGPSGQPTLVRLVAGASTCDIGVFQNSIFEMTAGEIEDGTLILWDNSRGELSGGRVSDDQMRFFGSSRLTITGGDIGPGFRTYENAEVFIYGSNFQIDGAPVGYGRIAVPVGNLTGDLLNGQIQASFGIFDDSSVTLVPEPATMLLVGLGGLGLLRKRCR
ncbi:MAG: PEP-CTERM sorting domain-containing protein [Sedimentisphaerales bacterium]|nr:PEP-CTERM sorting domain-containing protein [Sedimentisphaerales bacterium]